MCLHCTWEASRDIQTLYKIICLFIFVTNLLQSTTAVRKIVCFSSVCLHAIWNTDFFGLPPLNWPAATVDILNLFSAGEGFNLKWNIFVPDCSLYIRSVGETLLNPHSSPLYNPAFMTDTYSWRLCVSVKRTMLDEWRSNFFCGLYSWKTLTKSLLGWE